MGDIDKGEDECADKGEAEDDQDYLNLLSIHLRAESEKRYHLGMKVQGKLWKSEDVKVNDIKMYLWLKKVK